MMVLIETTISTAVEAAITPLVAELATTRRTVQEQAETIGRLTVDLERAASTIVALSTVQEAQPARAPSRWLQYSSAGQQRK